MIQTSGAKALETAEIQCDGKRATLPVLRGTEDEVAIDINQLRAKTGLLTRVSALSGLARRADGRTLVFSVLVNGFRGGAGEAIAALDAFAAALVETR